MSADIVIGPRGYPQWVKDPGATKNYGFDWSKVIPQPIEQSVWVVPDALTMAKSSHDGAVTEIWLSGGVRGKHYLITNHVKAGDFEDEKTFELVIKDQ